MREPLQALSSEQLIKMQLIVLAIEMGAMRQD